MFGVAAAGRGLTEYGGAPIMEGRPDATFRLKAVVMLVVTAVWAFYILSSVFKNSSIGLEWLGLPGAVFFALFGQVKRGNGNDNK